MQVEYSIDRVQISGKPRTITMHEGDANSETGSYGRNYILLQTTNRMIYVIGIKLVESEPNSEGVQIRTFGNDCDYPMNQKIYILFRNKMLFF